MPRREPPENLPPLPEEMQLQVFRPLLQAPEIKYYWDATRQKFKSIPNTPGIDFPQVFVGAYPLVWKGLYNDKTKIFKLDMTCAKALRFFDELRWESSAGIDRLAFTKRIAQEGEEEEDENSAVEADVLANFIADEMPFLQDVTVPVPDEPVEGGSRRAFQEWMWHFPQFLCEEFTNDSFQTIRLVHPRVYTNTDIPVYAYRNLMQLQRHVLGDDFVDEVWRDRVPDDLRMPLRPPQDAAELHKLRRLGSIFWWAWREKNYVVERGEQRAGEEGTVLVIRRLINGS